MGFADRRGKVARLLADGDLVALRRGLYASRRDLDPLGLAAAIYGPSYVSFETALAWHGRIPEAVREMMSATIKRPACFENSLGRFRYLRVPLAAYPVGVTRNGEGELPFLIASPTKALCDLIARQPGFRSMAEVGRWLDGMRFDPGHGLAGQELRDCAAAYRRPAVRWLSPWAEKKGWI